MIFRFDHIVFSGGDCGASPEREATDQVVRIGDWAISKHATLQSLLWIRKRDFCWHGQVKFKTSQLCNGCGIKTWNPETEMEPKPDTELEVDNLKFKMLWWYWQ